MSAETEHRGWEISSDYHEHWMDDCTYDLAEDAVESSWRSWLVVIGIAALLAGIYLTVVRAAIGYVSSVNHYDVGHS